MKVRCEKSVDPGAPGSAIRSRYNLTVGQEYLVLGQYISGGTYHVPTLELEFLVRGDDGLPHWISERIVTVTDPRLSARWEFRAVRAESVLAVWGYHRLVFDPDHFDGIQEADPEQRYLFQKEADLAQLDFPSDEIQQSATAIGGDWVQCPGCTEAWETDSMQPLLKCASCGSILGNPRWN